jgi:Carboxyltransferase domain, subdomain C and D
MPSRCAFLISRHFETLSASPLRRERVSSSSHDAFLLLQDHHAVVPPTLQVDGSVIVPDCSGWPETTAVLRQTPEATWRLAGDRYVFVEFGDMVLDFELRARVAELEQWLAANAPKGFVESSPGVRSALLEYDPITLPLPEMLKLLEKYASRAHTVQLPMCPARAIATPAFKSEYRFLCTTACNGAGPA